MKNIYNILCIFGPIFLWRLFNFRKFKNELSNDDSSDESVLQSKSDSESRKILIDKVMLCILSSHPNTIIQNDKLKKRYGMQQFELQNQDFIYMNSKKLH